MDPYDKSKIGALITNGWDHFVYEYDKDKVIKFSLFGLIQGKRNREKVIQDYLTSREFFGNYILETELKSSLNGKQVVLVQPKVSGRYLVKEDLQNESIKLQLKEIINANIKMVEAGHGSLDLIGHQGVLSKKFSNIFVTAENKLVIFDVMLMKLENLGIFYPFALVGWSVAKWRQRYLIRDFLGS